jgi:hypothetical protein
MEKNLSFEQNKQLTGQELNNTAKILIKINIISIVLSLQWKWPKLDKNNQH